MLPRFLYLTAWVLWYEQPPAVPVELKERVLCWLMGGLQAVASKQLGSSQSVNPSSSSSEPLLQTSEMPAPENSVLRAIPVSYTHLRAHET